MNGPAVRELLSHSNTDSIHTACTATSSRWSWRPADGGDQLTLRAYRLRQEGSGWLELYAGPVVTLEASAEQGSCPKCRHRWAPQVEIPVKCPKCSFRVGAFWRRQRQAAELAQDA